METYVLKKSRTAFYCLMLIVFLTGCAKENIRYDTKESTKALLPQIVEYSREAQNRASEEVRGGQCTALTEIAQGGLQLRDKIRLIKGELK